MRRILTLFAALLMAVGLVFPAYAAEATDADQNEYTELQQYVYLAQGANLYLGPDTSYDVYSTSNEDYNEHVVISGTYANGWVRFVEDGIWLYVASESVIYNEADAYTYAEYTEDVQKAEQKKQEAAQETKQAKIAEASKQYIVRTIILDVVAAILILFSIKIPGRGKRNVAVVSAICGCVCVFIPIYDYAGNGVFSNKYSQDAFLVCWIACFVTLFLVLFIGEAMRGRKKCEKS